MTRYLCAILIGLVAAASAHGATVLPIQSLVPTGTNLTGTQPLSSVSLDVANDGAPFESFTDLTGIGAVELTGSFSEGHANGLSAIPAVDTMLGKELSRALLGLGTGDSFRVYFAGGAVVNADGSDAPEVFVLEWASSRDNFQVQLLTSGPGEAPVIAATVQVRSSDYINSTGTSISTASVGVQPVGGVGINLDAVGVTGIRGIQIPGEDGLGGSSGLDPCVVVGRATAPNVPPTAALSACPAEGRPPLSVNFDASASIDTDGSIASYEWDFDGDGTYDQTTAAAKVVHVYDTSGSYQAKVRVVDDDGAGTVSSPVTITVAPGATILMPVTALTPTGGPLNGSQVVTSITAGGYTILDFTGPPDTGHVEIVGTMNEAVAQGLTATSAQQALVGLEMGRAVLGLDSTPGEFIRAYFESPANADGTDKPEVFVLEWAGSAETFQVQLLSSPPGQVPVVVATVPVLACQYTGTATIINPAGAGLDNQPVGGVAINLDGLGVSGITGVQIPSEGNTGVDPCVIAAVTKPCPVPFADADDDGDVDHDDFGAFQRCYTGFGIPGYDAVTCSCFDQKPRDGDVDEADFNAFRKCVTGPAIIWTPTLTPDCVP